MDSSDTGYSLQRPWLTIESLRLKIRRLVLEISDHEGKLLKNHNDRALVRPIFTAAIFFLFASRTRLGSLLEWTLLVQTRCISQNHFLGAHRKRKSRPHLLRKGLARIRIRNPHLGGWPWCSPLVHCRLTFNIFIL